MTSLIRSARFAPDSKAVPVPTLPAEVRKLVVQVAAHALASEPTAQRQISESPAPVMPPPPVVTSVVTYDEYKQRFSGELAELRQVTIQGAREQGLQQGRAAAETQFKQQLQTLRALIESIQSERKGYVNDLGDTAAEIVFAAVAKILGDGFEPSTAVAAVREAIRCSRERGRLLIRVAPEDFKLLSSYRAELLEGASTSDVELVADEQVKCGGCLLEGASGTLDARLETQMQRLREALVRARAKWDSPQGRPADE
jgi:flagellar assembly protein FliH